MDREKESCSVGENSQRKTSGKNSLQRYFLTHGLSFDCPAALETVSRCVKVPYSNVAISTCGLFFSPGDSFYPWMCDQEHPNLVADNLFPHGCLPPLSIAQVWQTPLEFIFSSYNSVREVP